MCEIATLENHAENLVNLFPRDDSEFDGQLSETARWVVKSFHKLSAASQSMTLPGQPFSDDLLTRVGMIRLKYGI